MSSPLTKRERKFCNHYLNSGNQLQTCSELGYTIKLHKKKIKQYLELNKNEEPFYIQDDPILKQLYAIATFDPASMYDVKGRLKAVIFLSEEQRMAISSITHGTYGVTYKFHSKQQALESLMKYKKLYDEPAEDEEGIEITFSIDPRSKSDG